MIQKERIDKFWDTVDKTEGPTGCWPWLGWKDDTGRGRFRLNGATVTAPRVALIIDKGLPDSTLHACHSCDNPECCNPSHLSWGTRKENMKDMARKGRAGIQRHPERYRKTRRPDVKYRPVKQSNAADGIDHRTDTRYATDEEMALAKRALVELDQEHNRIGLAPAPEPSFDGHKIRVIESRNPKWYSEFGVRYWKTPRQFDLKRDRVIKALERVAKGRVRGNGYEKDLLKWLKEKLGSPLSNENA